MKRLGAFILALAAIAGVVAALSIAGGPAEARREQADRDLYQAINDTALALVCDRPGATAPDAVPAQGDRYCESVFYSGERQLWSAKPAADVVMAYTKTGDTTFTICGTFHDANRFDDWTLRRDFEPDTGCLSSSITP